METREYMRTHGGNMEWCKPLKHSKEDIVLVVNEGSIESIHENGADVTVTDNKIKELAKKLNDDYSLYGGWNDTHILLDANFEEGECRDCPYIDTCEAMDAERNEG